MTDLKPNTVSFPVYNMIMYTSVAVFDVHATLLSILHEKMLMQMEVFAPGYDLFSGLCTLEVTHFGEVHTVWAFTQVMAFHCGDNPLYSYLPLIAFYDKTYTDLSGSLSCSSFVL